MTKSFAELGLTQPILDTLNELGYSEPTPIQAEAIPHLLQGRDVLGQAQTGTGKTAAFTLPTVQQISTDGLQMLVLTPTRELAIQVAQAVHNYGNKLGIRVLPVYGGQSYDRQERRLEKGVHVVVGTPGRTLDLINKRTLKLNNVRFVVLDEADEMLNMGFIEDIEAILSATPADTRQTILFSATFNNDIKRIANKYMRNPLQIAIESDQATATNVNQRYYIVEESDKIAALGRLLELEDQKNMLIFTRTRTGAAELAESLYQRGYPAVAIHGDLAQNERERILNRFRSGELTILVATDVMARGVDIPDVSHVINYDIPQLANEYIHRIGRTGRAGRSGDAITFITPRQRRQLKTIEHFISKTIDKAKLPGREDVLLRRHDLFKQKLVENMTPIDTMDTTLYAELLDMGYSSDEIALNLLEFLRQASERPLEEIASVAEHNYDDSRERRGKDRNRSRANGNDRSARPQRAPRGKREQGMVRLSMSIGRANGIKPGDIVYNIASKANIPGSVIGAIDIRNDETYLDVPDMYVDAVLNKMKNEKIRGRSMKLVRA